MKLDVGDVVEHALLGKGTVINVIGDTKGLTLLCLFLSFLLVRKKCIHGSGAGPCGDGRIARKGF